MLQLQQYGSSSESESEAEVTEKPPVDDALNLHLKPIPNQESGISSVKDICVYAAPVVATKASIVFSIKLCVVLIV